MRTGFSDEFGHEARMARMNDEASIAVEDRTWRSKLSGLFYSLLETTEPAETARMALELAEAAMDLERAIEQKAVEEVNPRVPTVPERIFPVVGLEAFTLHARSSLSPDDMRLSAEQIEAEPDEEDTANFAEEDAVDDGPGSKGMLLCPHGFDAGNGSKRCGRCARAEQRDYDGDPEYTDDLAGLGGD